MDLGARIKEKNAASQTPEAMTDLATPDRFPYETGPRSVSAAPVSSEDTCTPCGKCDSVCPAAAISVDGGVATEIGSCIRCCAREEPQIFGVPG